MPRRSCLVTVTSPTGVRHSVEVAATSVYEAASLALEVLRQDDWTEPLGPATRLEVEVRPPAARHVVTVQQLQRWAEGPSVSPDERVRKERVRTTLQSPRVPARVPGR